MRTTIAAVLLTAAALVTACVETPESETPAVANQPAPAVTATTPADPAPPIADADTDARERAKTSYRTGVDAYNRGDFAAAVAAFDASYRDFPSPAFLFNIGQAYRNLGDRPRAIEFYQRFLAEQPDINAAIRDSVQAYITELSKPP